MRYTAVLLLLLFIATRTAAQGYIADGQSKGGLTPYALGGIAINEGNTGIQGGIGIKTYGKDYAPLGGQVEVTYMNTGTNSATATTASFINFSFMGAVTTFRRYYNYHLAVGPSILFDVSGAGDNSVLYNFYPRIEGGAGYGIFMLKAGLNLSLNNSFTNLYSITLNVYPLRKKTWSIEGK